MTGESHRRLDIQGLRAFAVLAVVAYHAGGLLPGGFVGVDVFFVISGYVITGLLDRERRAHGRIRFGNFYKRRFLRLTPALALMVSVTLALGFVVLSPLGTQQMAAWTGIGAMLLVGNVAIPLVSDGYFEPAAAFNPLLNTWSLSVEEQFYLAFPALLAVAWWVGRRKLTRSALPAVAVLTLSAVSIALPLLPYTRFAGLPFMEWLTGFYSPMSRAWEFGVGALLWLMLGSRCLGRAAARIAALAGMILLLVAVVLVDDSDPWPGLLTLIPTTGTVLLIAAGVGRRSPLAWLLASRPAVAIGDWSYSLYLWHWPVIVMAGVVWGRSLAVSVVAAVLAFLPSYASYRWVESPGRTLTHLRPRLMGVLVTVTVAVPIVIASALLWVAHSQFGSSTIRSFEHAIRLGAADRSGCTDGLVGQALPSECSWQRSGSGSPVALVGDSIAGQFADGLIEATASLDRPLMVSVMNGCPMLDVTFYNQQWSEPQVAACQRFVANQLTYLESAPPSTVILASSDRIWSDPNFVVESDGERYVAGTAEARVTLEQSLLGVVNRLQRAGHQVVLVKTPPVFAQPTSWTDEPFDWDPQSCSALTLLTSRCTRSMPLGVADARQRDNLEAIEDVARSTGAQVVDLRSSICPDGLCTTERDGSQVFRDRSHISVGQSLDFSAIWRSLLSEPSR